jgi:hypothetical protein
MQSVNAQTGARPMAGRPFVLTGRAIAGPVYSRNDQNPIVTPRNSSGTSPTPSCAMPASFGVKK